MHFKSSNDQEDECHDLKDAHQQSRNETDKYSEDGKSLKDEQTEYFIHLCEIQMAPKVDPLYAGKRSFLFIPETTINCFSLFVY